MTPHNTSAAYYDFVFQKRFGSAYETLTVTNLTKITELLESGKILDFGAGTGRISIPLAKKGFEVTAVDISRSMLDQLQNKASQAGLEINCSESLTSCNGNSFDMVISIFTVFSYILKNEDMDYTIKQIYDCLQPGGLLMFDLVNKEGYQYLCRTNNCITNQKQLPDFKELVRVEMFQEEGAIYGNYQEHTKGLSNGNEFEYEENFKIRFWELKDIQSLLEDTLKMQRIEHFNFSNADYYVYKK